MKLTLYTILLFVYCKSTLQTIIIGNGRNSVKLLCDGSSFKIQWKSMDTTVGRMKIDHTIIQSFSKKIKHSKPGHIFRLNRYHGMQNSTLNEVPYYPSTTYKFTTSPCKCVSSVENYCIRSNCNVKAEANEIIFNTPPARLTMQVDYKDCKTNQCNISVELNNVQLQNSSLYLLAKNQNISVEEIEAMSKNVGEEMFRDVGKIIAKKHLRSSNGTSIETFMLNYKLACEKSFVLIARNEYETNVNVSVFELNFNLQCNGETVTNYLEISPSVITDAPDKINSSLGEGKTTFGKEESSTGSTPKMNRSSRKLKYIYLSCGALIAALTILFSILIKFQLHKKEKKYEKSDLEAPLTIDSSRNSMHINQIDTFLHNTTINDLIEEYMNVPNEIASNFYGANYDYKNRTTLPYQNTRVTLNCTSHNLDSDYINASYIQGFEAEKKYIAAQGPMKETVPDFWRMVWEQNVNIIIMLTDFLEDGRWKCEQYWPQSGAWQHKNLKVAFQSVKKFTNYTSTELNIQVSGEIRKVKHLHFKTWPTKEAPLTPQSLVTFLQVVRSHRTFGPILVHCSAGVGRTGAFILCDYIIDMAKTHSIDFPKALSILRNCRRNMVSQQIYYLYSYCVVNEFLKQSTATTVEDFARMYPQSKYAILSHLTNNNCYWLNLIHPCKSHPNWDQNKSKQKNPPLGSTGFVSEGRYYIDAIEIPIGGQKIINTSQPLRNNKGEFWRMILDRAVTVVLSLHSYDGTDKPIFWPTTKETKIVPVRHIEISLVSVKIKSEHDCYELLVMDTRLKWKQTVHLLDFKAWNRHELPKKDKFLNFYKHFMMDSTATSIAMACYDGSQGCSIFLTFLYLMETIKKDSIIDVPTAISTLQIYRRSLSLDKGAMKFICKTLHAFLNEDPKYENIPKLEIQPKNRIFGDNHA